ncbi:MAG: thiamine pyrophosphate-binding protein [Caldilineaceae bacterium]
MTQTGAQHLVQALVAAGVQQLFTLSGNQILSIYDATIGQPLRLLHTRHEAAAVHMADGWGRLTERPGVALLTAGPGHCNAISALYGARMAESPLVLLSGHAPLQQLGLGAFQEMDQVAIATPVTKAAWRVDDPDQLGQALERALQLAVAGRPGPVHLSLPVDVLEAPASTQMAGAGWVDPTPHLAPDDPRFATILEHLAAAQRPLLLAGPALARPQRWAAVTRFADIIQTPALPMESPRGVNDPWLHLATNLLAEADLVLLLGKPLDFAVRFGRPPFFAPSCRFIQIDAEAQALRQSDRLLLALHADPGQVVRQLATLAQPRAWPRSDWRDRVATARNTMPTHWQTLHQSEATPLHPLRLCAALQPYLDQGAVLVSDGGEFGQWVQAGLEAQIRLINGPSGSIGSAIPLALAAKVAHPERPVLVLSGDGAFGYHVLEFDTALRYQLPIIAIVGNDARWNAEVQLQTQHYGAGRAIGCELLPTRYDQVVAALGVHGEFVQHAEELAPALARALGSGLPACINVAIQSVAAPTLRGAPAHA